MYTNYNPYSGSTLKHYGVKGMKWGVRRDRDKGLSVRQARRAVNRDQAVRDAKKQMNRDVDAVMRTERRTKTFAITKRGKQKQAQREREFNEAFDRLQKSKKAYSQARDKAVNDVAKKVRGGYTAEAKRQMVGMSTGRKLTQDFLLGGYGSQVYTNAKTKGLSNGQAVTRAILANWGNNITLGSLKRAADRS